MGFLSYKRDEVTFVNIPLTPLEAQAYAELEDYKNDGVDVDRAMMDLQIYYPELVSYFHPVVAKDPFWVWMRESYDGR